MQVRKKGVTHGRAHTNSTCDLVCCRGGSLKRWPCAVKLHLPVEPPLLPDDIHMIISICICISTYIHTYIYIYYIHTLSWINR